MGKGLIKNQRQIANMGRQVLCNGNTHRQQKLVTGAFSEVLHFSRLQPPYRLAAVHTQVKFRTKAHFRIPIIQHRQHAIYPFIQGSGPLGIYLRSNVR